MGAKFNYFCLFSAYFYVFSPDLLMDYQIFISIIDISANLKYIHIDKAILENINIDKCHSKLFTQDQCNWCHKMLIDANWMLNVQMFQCSNVSIFQWSNVPMCFSFPWVAGVSFPLVHWLSVKCHMSYVKCQKSNFKNEMSNVHRVKLLSERTSGVPQVTFCMV